LNHKLLLDQNISYKLVKNLQEIFPNSSHVRLESLQNADDKIIREFALSNGFNIVTFDIDFYETSLIEGYPPKIIWLRCGNSSTKNIENILKTSFTKIIDFLENKNFSCLELF